MAVSTAVSASPSEQLKSRKASEATKVDENEKKDSEDKKDKGPLEFAHSFPIHTKPCASILSKENTEGLSFRGFGNVASFTHPDIAYSSARDDIR
jgi:hypothetical protein